MTQIPASDPNRLVTTPPIALSSIWTCGGCAGGCWAPLGRPAAIPPTAIANAADDDFQARMLPSDGCGSDGFRSRSTHPTTLSAPVGWVERSETHQCAR